MIRFSIDRRIQLARGLKAARLRAGLTSEQAALEVERRGVQCRRGTLLAWERGNGPTSREPYASDLSVLAEIYRCSVGELFAVPLDGAATNGQPHAHLTGRSDGRHDGNANGHTDGQHDGHTDGHTDGHHDGHHDGHADGVPRAHAGGKDGLANTGFGR